VAPALVVVAAAQLAVLEPGAGLVLLPLRRHRGAWPGLQRPNSRLQSG
jgi:hypothetical protein